MTRFVFLFLLASASLTSALGQHIEYWGCSPLSYQGDQCYDMDFYVNNGYVLVQIGADCAPTPIHMDADGSARAINCATPVDLNARTVIFFGSIPEAIDAKGEAYFSLAPSPRYPWWQMWKTRWCDGTQDEFIQPPAPC